LNQNSSTLGIPPDSVRAEYALAKPVDWQRFVYPDLLRAIRPDRVNFSLPPA
jgi:hypothetical protein